MKLFSCEECGQQLYFESTSCVQCGSRLGYHPEQRDMRVLRDSGSGGAPEWAGGGVGERQVLCLNGVERDACNWLVPSTTTPATCQSCSLTELFPDLSIEANLVAWKRLEAAKRRLLFTLSALGLPVASKAEAPATGLAFRFLQGTSDKPVITGHDDGIITLDAREADPAHRETQRERLDEKYRTTLGHLRHEVGHYYFDRLIKDEGQEPKFRAVFGDERASYEESLKRHYESGPPAHWEQTHISAYATMHPWEDWAETFAHYLHMVDTFETARSYGLAVRQPEPGGATLRASALDVADFKAMMEGFHVVTLALNGLNRSMGLPDAYPFAISPAAWTKLEFVHDVIDPKRRR